MQGYDVLWQAGVDHAGIATQLVVERKLNEKGITKEKLGREGFTKEVLKWKEEAQTKIIEQIKKLGASCDFSNIAFTFSPEFNKAVNKAFVTLFKQGLIYQDYRLVNWDTKFNTAISDLEVTNKEEEGYLYYIKYQINDKEDIVIATTRPETMFGDTAIAVNPKDERYIHLIGKEATIPIINKKIPIIADDYSNMDKGSGAVKITPAHDFNDFEVAKRHNLPLIIVIDQHGKINNNGPVEFQSLTVKEARKRVIEYLEKLNCLVKVDKHIMQVPYGDRSGTVIEPLPSKQWFLDVKNMAMDAIDQVRNEVITLIPSSWKNLYFEWLNNIKPWCISRQLWWGHRIPVWYSEEVMVSGFAAIAGSVMGGYIAIGMPAQYILSSVLLTIPGSIFLAKLIYPETSNVSLKESAKLVEEKLPEEKANSIIEAISIGTYSGLKGLAPDKIKQFSKLAVKAMVAALMANILNGVIAGIMFDIQQWLAN
ncbi:UNVERIFIED_CONTAM: hypothetical protein PYX00_011948 [Menopon gallinae]|uniref:valine--tRNA ligase n=1 Tax=Menopon gallinae TaxID=328185 RepID=A0AAW2H966_9NEOP